MFLVIQGERLDSGVGDHRAVGKLCTIAVIGEKVAGEVERKIVVGGAVGIGADVGA